MLRLLLVMALTISLGGILATASAGSYRRMVVFGDSLSDIGNISIVTHRLPLQSRVPKSPPYLEGRFSNGRVWVERLADRLDLDVEPFLAGGTNFAFGGAETAFNTDKLFSRDIGFDVFIPSIRSQVRNLFLGRPLSNSPFPFDFPFDLPFDIPSPVDDADSRNLYIVWGGANDLRNAVNEGAEDTDIARSAANRIADAIEDLADNGAVHFLVPNMPDLGLTPESRDLSPERKAFATTLSDQFNRTLETALQDIETEFAVSISRLDTFTPLREAVTNGRFGFANVMDACLMVDGDASDAPFDGGDPCMSPDMYLFWDFIHPTAAAHTVLADLAFAALPPLVAIAGNQNPDGSVTVSGSAQNLPVLQVRLGTTAAGVRLTGLIVNFSRIMGDPTLLESLRVRLTDDANANGLFDAGEEDVLGTREVQTIPSVLTLDIVPPLVIDSATTRHLLVTLDINQLTGSPGGTAASPLLRRMSFAALGGPVLLLPLLSIVCLARRRRSIGFFMVLIVLSWGLVLPGCRGGDNGGAEETLTFTVALPAQGLRGQTEETSEALDQPPLPLTGTRVTLRP